MATSTHRELGKLVACQSVWHASVAKHNASNGGHDSGLVPRTARRSRSVCRHAERRSCRAVSSSGPTCEPPTATHRSCWLMARRLVWAARLLKQPLPERVAGSDLVPQLFASARSSAARFLVRRRAGRSGAGRVPRLRINGRTSASSAPIRRRSVLKMTPRKMTASSRSIADASPDLVIVGLGAPKQEIWVHRHHRRIAGQGRHLCRSNDRLSGRPSSAISCLDASRWPRMAPSPVYRAPSVGEPLRSRRLGLSAACVAPMARRRRVTGYPPLVHRGYIRPHACKCFGHCCRRTSRFGARRLRQHIVCHSRARSFRCRESVARLVLCAVARPARYLSRLVALSHFCSRFSRLRSLGFLPTRVTPRRS